MQEGLAQTAFTPNAADEVKKCTLGASCIGLNGLVVIQRSDMIMDMPGGAARALTPFYWLVPYTCEGKGETCKAFSDFDRSVDLLAAQPLDIHLRVRFQNDGERKIVCQGTSLDADYLKEVGWTQISCTTARVTKDSLFWP